MTGPLFNEGMRVETVTAADSTAWTLRLVGTRSERFRKASLTSNDFAGLTILESSFRYDGDSALLRLGLRAYALGIVWEFDPYFGLPVSRVDPLPHQLEAVYDHLLKLPRVRILLPDDAVAGKTIMAGLLVRELQRVDDGIGRVTADVERGRPDAEDRFAMEESRHRELLARRERRRGELQQQRTLSLQGVERITSVALLPHPDRTAAEVRRHQPEPRTEATAMRVVMDHERERGRRVEDVSADNVGYDVTSLDPVTGDLRLIEVKGLGAGTGTVLLPPNERWVAEDRPDCYWLYVVTDCGRPPVLQAPIPDRASFPWREVSKGAALPDRRCHDGPDASVGGVGRIAKQLRHDRAGASMTWVWSYRDLSPRSTRRVVA